MKLHLENYAFVRHAGVESVVWCPCTGGCIVLRNAQLILEEIAFGRCVRAIRRCVRTS